MVNDLGIQAAVVSFRDPSDLLPHPTGGGGA
jgi:hypothetical protein